MVIADFAKRGGEIKMEEHHQLKSILDSINAIIFIADRETSEILFLNKNAQEIWGNIVGKKCWLTVQEDQTKTCEYCTKNKLLKENDSPAGVFTWEFQNTKTNMWYDCHGSDFLWADGRMVLLYIATDITDHKQAEEKLLESELRWHFALEGAGDGVWDWNVQTNEVFFSSQWKNMLGFADHEIGSTLDEWDKRVHPDDKKRCYEDLEKHFRGEAKVYQNEHRLLCKEGTYKWILDRGKVIKWATDGKPLRIIGTHTDITDRKQYEEQLKYLSLHDQLTGLYNRTFFEEELLSLRSSRKHPITIISVDVDGLKLINDTMGHRRGDELLKSCAIVLKQSLRKYDILARVGGDEFAAILPYTDEKTGQEIAERMWTNVGLYNRGHDADIHLSISIGIATAETEDISSEETFRKSDELMYREKLRHCASVRSKIIDTLMTTLAVRDFITEGHAQRLTKLCFVLGKKLGLSSRQLNDLALLAQVHDLGKVGMPDSILFKNGSLSDEEWDIVRLHPEKGYRIASSFPDLLGVADLILKHHERWDGKGYPLGLKGEEIPIECRVLAIVDAFDAMTSDRPYSKAKSKEEAISELKRCSGTQFDSALVDAFLSLEL